MRLRLISWNLHGPPPAPRIIPRLRAVAREIARRAPDVVLLQELWTQVQSNLISRRLPDYERVDPPTRGWLRTAGLMTLVSRSSAELRVVGSRFESYLAHAPAWKLWEGDGLSQKGILTVDLTRGSERLSVTNTHLQASYGPGGYPRIRAAQLEQLRAALAREPKGVPTLVGGDLNTRPQENLWGELRNETLDLTRRYRERCDCGTSVGGGSWIDYVLARRDPAWSIEAIRVDRILSRRRDDPYSDHQGLDLEIELRRTRNPHATGALERLYTPATRRAWLLCVARLLVRGPLG